MARTVTVRLTYMADRGRLSRFEEAVSKDPRLAPEKKAEILDLVRRLQMALMEVDKGLPPVFPGELATSHRRR